MTGTSGPSRQPAEGDLDWPITADERGVTEIRVHGVGGGSPTAMLDDPTARQITGDRVAGVWRGLDWRVEGRSRWHREVYSWGGLTSKALSSALWLVLLPFALVNLAGWMALGGRGRETGPANWLIVVQQNMTRVVGLGVTWLYLIFSAQMAMDLGAWQCARTTCRADGVWKWLHLDGHPHGAAAVAAVIPLAQILVMARLTAVSKRRYDEHGATATSAPATERVAPADLARITMSSPHFWTARTYDEPARRIHLASSVLVIAFLLLSVAKAGGKFPDVVRAAWLVVGALLAVAVVCAAWDGLRRLVAEGSAAPVYATAGLALGAAWLAVAVQPAGTPAEAGIMPGIVGFFDVVLVVIYLAGLLHGVVAVAGLRQVRALSDWAKPAWFPAPIVALVVAVAMTLAVGSGIVVWVARWLSPEAAPTSGEQLWQLSYPVSYTASAQLNVTGVLAVVVVFAVVAGISVWCRRREPDVALAAEFAVWKQYEARPGWQHLAGDERDGRWLRSVRTWLWLAGAARWLENLVVAVVLLSSGCLVAYAVWAFAEWRGSGFPVTLAICGIVLLFGAGVCAFTAAGTARHSRAVRLGAIAAFAAGLALVVGVADRGLPKAGADTPPLEVPWLFGEAIATTVLALIPVAGVLLLRRAIRSDSTRRAVGVAWDITTFWPRGFHPLAPPSYAQRAVPDLVHRTRALLSNGNAVLLCGHSQGAALTAAALAQLTGLEEEHRARLSVITYGNPLGHLYMRWFPTYVNEAFVDECLAVPAGNSWVNFYRHTDPVGRELFRKASPECRATEPAAGRDCWLPDPPTDLMRPGDGPPRIRQHGNGGYLWQSPAAAHLVREAHRLESLTRRSSPMTDQVAVPGAGAGEEALIEFALTCPPDAELYAQALSRWERTGSIEGDLETLRAALAGAQRQHRWTGSSILGSAPFDRDPFVLALVERIRELSGGTVQRRQEI